MCEGVRFPRGAPGEGVGSGRIGGVARLWMLRKCKGEVIKDNKALLGAAFYYHSLIFFFYYCGHSFEKNLTVIHYLRHKKNKTIVLMT
jgi:hypothetical protein